MGDYHVVLDVGQTGMRAQVRETGTYAVAYTAEFPGVRTDIPIFPQLADVIGQVRRTSGITSALVSCGVSGLREDDPVEQLLRLIKPHGVTRLVAGHDSVTSYLGALGDRRGVVCAAGTGVVTLAVGAEQVARVDGWGNLMGDAGAGYWIGRLGLESVMRAYDKRGPATALTAVALEAWPNLENAYIDLQNDERKVSRIASYARHVDRLADEGDQVCLDIMKRAAAELFLACATGLDVVGEAAQASPAVCTIGNVFRSRTLAAEFGRLLDERWPGLSVRKPVADGLAGAGLLPYVAPDSALRAKIVDLS